MTSKEWFEAQSRIAPETVRSMAYKELVSACREKIEQQSKRMSGDRIVDVGLVDNCCFDDILKAINKGQITEFEIEEITGDEDVYFAISPLSQVNNPRWIEVKRYCEVVRKEEINNKGKAPYKIIDGILRTQEIATLAGIIKRSTI